MTVGECDGEQRVWGGMKVYSQLPGGCCGRERGGGSTYPGPGSGPLC